MNNLPRRGLGLVCLFLFLAFFLSSCDQDLLGKAYGPYVAGDSNVTRSFSSATIQVNDSLNVTLEVNVLESDTYYAVEEYVPAGFIILDPDDANYTNTSTNTLKWLYYTSGSIPASSTSHTYTVQAPTTPGNYTFNGSFQFEFSTDNNTVYTLGDQVVEVLGPAGPVCGDGIIEAPEQCDNGSALNGVPCTPPYGGSCTWCDGSCTIQTENGGFCGDGTIQSPNEDCDGANLGGNDCTTLGQGFTGGTLSCNGSCAFDNSSCTVGTGNQPPTTSSVVLDSTSGAHDPADDLFVTFTTNDPDGDAVTNTTDWRVASISIALLNMPFNTNTSTTTLDYSTYANHGSLGEGTADYEPRWTPNGMVGGAYDFDGSNDRIGLGDESTLEGMNEITVAAWVYPHDIGAGFKTIISKEDVFFLRKRDDSDSLHAVIFTTGGLSIRSSTNPIQLNQWQHVAMTYDGAQFTVYINGVEDSSQSANGALQNSTYPVRIGRHSSDSETDYFDGIIDEVVVLDRALSADQINNLYQAGLQGAAVTTLDADETQTGDVWSVAVTPSDGTVDGTTVTSNAITIGSSPGCTDSDGDLFNQSAVGCGVADCDDSDPLEFPDQTWYLDQDGDLYGEGSSQTACERPVDYYVVSELNATSGDCDDGDAGVNPGASENAIQTGTCADGVDNNCDGEADWDGVGAMHGDAGCEVNLAVQPLIQFIPQNNPPENTLVTVICQLGQPHNVEVSSVYSLFDGAQCAFDHYALANNYIFNCFTGPYTGVNTTLDCGVNTSLSYSSQSFISVQVAVQPNCTDADGDLFNQSAVGCGVADCDDTNASIYPGAVEVCNGVDDNCDNVTDEANGDCGGALPYCVAGSCVECVGNPDCDDGAYCNGQEVCSGNVCQSGAVVDCSSSDVDVFECTYNPDNIDTTFDAYSFVSSCNESSDSCSVAPLGWESSIVHSCDIASCGAECEGDGDCPNVCNGDTRYYNGSCQTGGDCSCAYLTEDCNAEDGWYNTSTYQWVDIVGDQCREKEQRQQAYREYGCTPAACTFSVTGNQWVDTGATRDKTDGTSCNDGAYCTVSDACNAGNCEGLPRDCSASDTLVDSCLYDPDAVDFTYDAYSFVSSCNESSDSCSVAPLGWENSITHSCDITVCSAECEGDGDCAPNSCSVEFNESCLGAQLVEYGIPNDVMDSTTVVDSCSNTCQGNCSCTDCGVSCNEPATTAHCVLGVCGAACDSNADCDDGNPGTVDTCLADCSCQNTALGNCTMDAECDNGVWCDGEEFCNTTTWNCQSGVAPDCSLNDTVVNSCLYDPDAVDVTLDQYSFLSSCNETTDSCTVPPLGWENSITHSCDIASCGAECENDGDCIATSCSVPFSDYCNDSKLVEYDNDYTLDSTTVADSCSNTCQGDCSCTNCTPDCSPPPVNTYCVMGVCGAVCDTNADCDDSDPGTIDTCLANCSCSNTLNCTDGDTDGFSSTGGSCGPLDCDDTDALEFPGQVWYLDQDGDLYSDGTQQVACERPLGAYFAATELTAVSGDCDDTNSSFNPGMPETCNYLDDNCDNTTDEGFTYEPAYQDNDGDSYGNQTTELLTCPLDLPDNHTRFNDSFDCNDGNPAQNPGETETCDGIDNDCDGFIDANASGPLLQYSYSGNLSQWGVGECVPQEETCTAGTFVITQNETFPQPEVCDGLDNDCDTNTDEEFVCGAVELNESATQQLTTPLTSDFGTTLPGVRMSIPVSRLATTGVQNVTVYLANWTGILPGSVYVEENNTNISSTFDSGTRAVTWEADLSVNDTLVYFTIPFPTHTVEDENTTDINTTTTYSKTLTIVSDNHLTNVQAQIAVQGGFTNWRLVQEDPYGGDVTGNFSLVVDGGGGVATFSGFDLSNKTFTITGTSTESNTTKLTIWDDSDLGAVFINESLNWYANYSDTNGTPIQGASCSIFLENIGLFSMTPTNESSHFIKENESYPSGGFFMYSIECGGNASYDILADVSDTWIRPYCGDGVCDSAESCSSCSGDCGTCPTGDSSPLFIKGSPLLLKGSPLLIKGSPLLLKGEPPLPSEKTTVFEFDEAIYKVTVEYNDSTIINVTLNESNESIDADLLYEQYAFIPSLDFDEATVEFRVLQDWIEENNADLETIVLKRKDASWFTLSSYYVRQDDTYVYFKATTTELGAFAITALQDTTNGSVESPFPFGGENDTNGTFEDDSFGDALDTPEDNVNFVIYLGIIVVMILVLGGFFYWRSHHLVGGKISSIAYERLAEVRQFIQVELDKGVTPSKIKEMLANVGWKKQLAENLVDEIVQAGKPSPAETSNASSAQQSAGGSEETGANKGPKAS